MPAPKHTNTFLLVPVFNLSFGSFVQFAVRFLTVNPELSPSRETYKQAWTFAVAKYKLVPDVKAARIESGTLVSALSPNLIFLN